MKVRNRQRKSTVFRNEYVGGKTTRTKKEAMTIKVRNGVILGRAGVVIKKGPEGGCRGLAWFSAAAWMLVW